MLFRAGGLGSGAPSVLSIERFVVGALSKRALLVLISWARRPRTVSTASSSSLYASMCVGFESYRSNASIGGSGGGSIDDGVCTDLLRKRCAAGSSRVARPTVGAAFVRRPRRRRAWLALRGRESAVFQSGAFALVLRHDRLAHRAVRACSAVARDQIKRCPSRVCQYYLVPAEV